jgi:hypothetical protein
MTKSEFSSLGWKLIHPSIHPSFHILTTIFQIKKNPISPIPTRHQPFQTLAAAAAVCTDTHLSSEQKDFVAFRVGFR